MKFLDSLASKYTPAHHIVGLNCTVRRKIQPRFTRAKCVRANRIPETNASLPTATDGQASPSKTARTMFFESSYSYTRRFIRGVCSVCSFHFKACL
jgi:hypothetical protein